MWTNEYYVLNKENPGSAENPNALKKYIKNRTDHPKVPLYFPGGEAISACEKFRNAMFMGGILGDIDDANAGIDPRHHCVKFDDGTGETGVPGCIYTDAWCTRMGMKHRYNAATGKSDCYKDGGQEVSEFLFGQTITRGIYRGIHAIGENMCNPCCKVTEYCENNTCKPKHELGHNVGNNNRHKCLSGQEAWGKCVECRDGKNGGFMCDGNKNTKNGHDCTNNACYCDDVWGSSTYDTCVPKKNEGEHVGVGADYKCKSGKEAYSRCVQCRDGRNDTVCESHQYCGDTWGHSEYDKCVPKQGIGKHVPGVGERGYKCLSGNEAFGKCVQCKDGAHGAYHCTGKVGLDLENTITAGDDVTHLRWEKVNRAPSNGIKLVHEGLLKALADKASRAPNRILFEEEEWAALNINLDFINRNYVELNINANPIIYIPESEPKKICGRDGECYCGDDMFPFGNGREHDKCIFKKKNGSRVGPYAGRKCISALEAHMKCVACRDGAQGAHHCNDKVGTQTSDSTPVTAGPDGLKKCKRDGECYCEDNGGGLHDGCVFKKRDGAHVGPYAGRKCTSGLEAHMKCVECRDGANGAHHCNGKEGRQVSDSTAVTAGADGKKICNRDGQCYCGDSGSEHDKCIFERKTELMSDLLHKENAHRVQMI